MERRQFLQKAAVGTVAAVTAGGIVIDQLNKYQLLRNITNDADPATM